MPSEAQSVRVSGVIVPPMALTETQVVILCFFCIDKVSSIREMSDNLLQFGYDIEYPRNRKIVAQSLSLPK